jgi:hypothetical protein
MSFSQIPWFLLCGGLTVVGLIGSWFTLRRRGGRAAARMAAWSLLPIALYLIGIIQPIWNFAYGLVFSPKVWTGLVVLAVAFLTIAVTGGIRGRSAKKEPGEKKRDEPASGPAQLTASPVTGPTARTQPAPAPAKRKRAAPGDDDDFGEVADILKRHGIS